MLMLTSLVLFAVDNSGVIIVVIIVSILLLAILGSVFYFLYKKGKLPCGRSGKQEMYVLIFFPSIYISTGVFKLAALECERVCG